MKKTEKVVRIAFMINKNTTEVFLDLDKLIGLTDEEIGKHELVRFEMNIKEIGKRSKEIDILGMSYSTVSVKYFHQVKKGVGVMSPDEMNDRHAFQKGFVRRIESLK